MTREEAIKFGYNIIMVADKETDSEAIEFTRMAIKALETIPKYKDAYGKGWDDGAKATYEHLKMCEEEISGDLVSRDAVLDIIHRFFTEEVDKIPTKKTEDGEVYVIHKCQPLFEMNKAICKRIKALPSVTAEPTGHWKRISMDKYSEHAKYWYRCDRCGKDHLGDTDWCPSCGARMESEGKE